MLVPVSGAFLDDIIRHGHQGIANLLRLYWQTALGLHPLQQVIQSQSLVGACSNGDWLTNEQNNFKLLNITLVLLAW